MFYAVKLVIVIAATVVLSLGDDFMRALRCQRQTRVSHQSILDLADCQIQRHHVDRRRSGSPGPTTPVSFCCESSKQLRHSRAGPSVAPVPATLDRQERASLDTFLRLGDVGGEAYYGGPGGFVGRAQESKARQAAHRGGNLGGGISRKAPAAPTANCCRSNAAAFSWR